MKWRLPGQGKGLDKAEAFHGFDHAFFHSQAGVLDSPKRRVFDPVAWHFIDIYGSHFQFLDEA